MKHEYPKFIYHKSEPAMIVHSKEEEASLGKGWADSPAAFEQSSVEQSFEAQESLEKNKKKIKKDNP